MATMPVFDFVPDSWVINDPNYLVKWNNSLYLMTQMNAAINVFGEEVTQELADALQAIETIRDDEVIPAKNTAVDAASKSQEWAELDTEVEPGKDSAKTWALRAEQIVTGDTVITALKPGTGTQGQIVTPDGSGGLAYDDITIAYVQGLQTALTAKADLVDGKVPAEQLPDTGISATTLTKTFGAGEQYILTTPSSTDAPIVGVTKEVPQIGVTTNQWETAVSEQSMTVQTGLQFGANGLEIDLTGGTYVGEYLSAVTSSSINTDFWIDINSMTPDDSDNIEFISYALSGDGRTVFYIIKSGSGSRDIVRDNLGTWQFNSSSLYSETTWTDSAENTLMGALSESQSTASAAPAGLSLQNPIYLGSPLDVSNKGSPVGVSFSPSGDKMLVVFNSSTTIVEYTLSTPGNPSTAVETGMGLNVIAQMSVPRKAIYSDSGSKVLVVDSKVSPSDGDAVYQYNLSTSYQLDSGSYSGNSLIVGATANAPTDIALNGQENILYIANQNGFVYEFTLPTPSTVTGGVYSGNSTDVSGLDSSLQGVCVSETFDKLIAIGQATDSMYEFTLSTRTYTGRSFSVATQDGNPRSLATTENGTKVTIGGFATQKLYQYSTEDVFSLNRMNPSDLDSLSDADFPAVTTSLDLAITLRTDSGGTTPTTKGVSINYDANTADELARHITDYKVQKLSDTELRFEAVTSGNYKVRVI